MIRVYEQEFTEADAQAAYDSVSSGILSPFGPKVSELEDKFAELTDRRFALACTSGTSALTLALTGLSITDCRVAVPSCAFAAVASVPLYLQNRIEFIDADRDSWNLDLDDLEKKCQKRAKEDPIVAVISVHNYGNPVNYHRLGELSKKYGFVIVEDACEALCASFDGVPAGAMGDVSVFSFYGNKLIAGGQGGMILTDNEEAYNLIKLYRAQGQDPCRQFWHIVPGFNFRMTNVQAAIIVSQFNRMDEIQKKKLKIYETYVKNLPKKLRLQKVDQEAVHSWWMISVQGGKGFYNSIRTLLEKNGIETRPVFPPLSQMPAFDKFATNTPVAAELYDRGLTLPSGPKTTIDQVKFICSILKGRI